MEKSNTPTTPENAPTKTTGTTTRSIFPLKDLFCPSGGFVLIAAATQNDTKLNPPMVKKIETISRRMFLLAKM
jgi:hypothetical protein